MRAVHQVLSWLNLSVIAKDPPPATPGRPVGNLVSILSDLHARSFVPERIVDVGANNCSWSGGAASIFSGAKFFLIEPIPAFEPSLRTFIAQHPGSKYWLAAAGAETGEAEINEIDTSDGRPTSGSTFLNTEHAAAYRTLRRRVPVITLDSLFSKEGCIPDPIKLDVEGFELQALKGSSALLGRTEVFIIETSLYPFWQQPIFHEMVNYIVERGYVVYDFAGFNRRPIVGALGQVDVCFVLKESRLRRPGGWDF